MAAGPKSARRMSFNLNFHAVVVCFVRMRIPPTRARAWSCRHHLQETWLTWQMSADDAHVVSGSSGLNRCATGLATGL